MAAWLAGSYVPALSQQPVADDPQPSGRWDGAQERVGVEELGGDDEHSQAGKEQQPVAEGLDHTVSVADSYTVRSVTSAMLRPQHLKT